MERAHFREEREQIEARIDSIREQLSYTSMLDLVRTIDAVVVDSASEAGIKAASLPIVRDRALQDAFYICFLESQKPARNAVELFYDYLANHIRSLQDNVFAFPPHHGLWVSHIDLSSRDIATKFQESFALYNLAVSSVITEKESGKEGQYILRALVAALDLSYEELGRMFGVAGETTRRWETGTSSISSDRKAAISSTKEPMDKLLKIFRHARLPQVIRRAAELFGGERAVDWILRGKIADVANRYEIALRYQA